MGMDVADGIKWYLVFLTSTSFHEASHAWAALKLGDPTAAGGGLATLDPSPHIKRSPFGMVVVPLLSYAANGWMIGWASVPYNTAWALKFPRRAALMALAGPAANLTIVLVSALLMRLGVEWGLFHGVSSPGFLNMVTATGGGDGPAMFAAKFLSLFFSLNLLLAAFNLLPLPPLDGGNLPLLVLPPALSETYAAAIRLPAATWFGLFVAWNIFGELFSPLFHHAVKLLYFFLGNG